MSETWTPLRVLEWTTARFRTAAIDSPRLEAELLLAHILECSRVSLYTNFDKPLAEAELASYRGLIKRRLAGEPTAYLLGAREFWSLQLSVDSRVLVPRPDTETLVQVAVDSAAARIAEIGTGSGAIAIAVATELSQAKVVATDISEDALAVARMNTEAHGVAGQVELRHGDLLAPLGTEQFELLVANLPYIPTADIAGLSEEVRAEPRRALDGGADGLELLRRLIAGAPAQLTSGGLLALEHGFDQAPSVAELIRATGAFGEPTTVADLAGQPRVTCAVRR